MLLSILIAATVIFLLYAAFLAVCAAAVDGRREYDTHSRFYRALLNGATAMALKAARIKVHTTGMEKVPQGERLLFVGNHRSKFDPIITWYLFRKWDIAFLSKKENFRVPIFGRIIRKCCFLAIDRENPREALKTVNKAAGLLENGTVSIGVYPEGTRSRTGELLPFHNGVLKIAQKAGAPIVVLAIRGTEKIAKIYPLHRSDVYLDVVDVVPAEKVCGTRSSLLSQAVYEKLSERLQ